MGWFDRLYGTEDDGAGDALANLTPERLETLVQEADAYRDIRRDMEDIGYWLMNTQASHLDLQPRQRERIYRRALRYYTEDPIVGRSIEMRPTYIFGRGLPKPTSDQPKIQEALDTFWNDPDNKAAITGLQGQYGKDIELQLQGNIYFVIFEDQDKGIKIATLPHDEVTDIIVDPQNKQRHLWYKREFTEQVYDFGTDTYSSTAGTTRTVWYQHWKNDPPRVNGQLYRPRTKDGETIGKGRIYHVRVGGVPDQKFGTPSVNRILDWAKAHNDWVRARVAIAKAAQQFAWERKVKTGVNPNQVTQIARNWASGVRQPTGATGDWDGTGTNQLQSPTYGSMLTTTDAVDYQFRGGENTGGKDAAIDQKIFRSMISAGTGLPQHFLGDEGSANLATATAMNEPVIRMMEFYQELWETIFRDLLDHHLKVCGLIEQDDNKMQEAAGTGGVGDLGINQDQQQVKIGGPVLDPMAGPEENDDKATYKLSFPPILGRDVATMLGVIAQTVAGLDPNGDNVDLTRWAFMEILKAMGEVDPDKIADSIFPHKSMGDHASNPADQPSQALDGQDPMTPVGDISQNSGPDPFAPTGQGNSMDGAQDGARMGTSLQQSAFEDWFGVEQELTGNGNEPTAD